MAAAVFADLDTFQFSNNGLGNHAASSLYEDQRALQLAVELSKFSNGFQQQQQQNCHHDSHSSSCSDPGYSDTDLLLLSQRKSQNTTECVPVPSSEHVAEIVGRQGCKIKALRAKTNTYIKTPVRGEEPVFVVTGRKEDVESAKQEILSAADHFTQIRASRRHSQGGIPAPGHITAYVRVPYKLVGLVVGPKGATIKRIQQQTHTYIITPSRDKEPIFEVTGLPDNVETARSEIELHIASRTGSFSPSFDSKDASIMDEFHLNGTEIGFNGGGGGVEDCYVDSQVTAAAVKSLRSMSYSTTTVNSNNNVSAQSFGATSMNLLNSQVQNGCHAWLPYAASNLTGGDQDEGVWSMSGDSPTSLSVEPLIPPCLSSIWSDLEDPKDMFPRRSASISVPTVESNGSLFPTMASQMASLSINEQRAGAAGTTTAGGIGPQRRFSSAPTTSGLYRQVIQNMLALNSSCQVCQQQPVQASLEPCGHRCFCLVCATRLCQMPTPVCPICQAPVAHSVRLVRNNLEKKEISF